MKHASLEQTLLALRIFKADLKVQCDVFATERPDIRRLD